MQSDVVTELPLSVITHRERLNESGVCILDEVESPLFSSAKVGTNTASVKTLRSSRTRTEGQADTDFSPRPDARRETPYMSSSSSFTPAVCDTLRFRLKTRNTINAPTRARPPATPPTIALDEGRSSNIPL